MWLALIGVLALQIVTIYVPVAQRLFDTTALQPDDWVLPLLAASTIILAEESMKRTLKRRVPAGRRRS